MNLPKYKNCVLDHRYFLGSFKDYSGNGNDGTPSSVNFVKVPDKHVNFEGTDKIAVADSSELQLTEATLVAYGDFSDKEGSSVYKRIVNKNGEWDLIQYPSAGRVRFIVAGTTRDVVTTKTDYKSIVVSFENGEIPNLYLNGVFESAFAGSVTNTPTSNFLSVGNYYTGNSPCVDPIKGILVYNTVLSAQEIAQVHEWIMDTTTPSYTKKNFVYPSQITGRENGIVGAWDMESIHGKVIDKTGNGNNGTITGAKQRSGYMGLKSLGFNGGADVISFPSTPDFSSGFTINHWINPASTGGGNNGFVFTDGTTTSQFRSSSKNWRIMVNFTTTAAITDTSTSSPLSLDKPTMITGVLEEDNTISVYFNGVKQTGVLLEQAGVGAISVTTGNPSYIGNRPDLLRGFDGEIFEPQILNRRLTPTEVATLYQKYAKLPKFVDKLQDANESVSANASGYLENTNWKIDSGNWKISRDEDLGVGQKVIECTGSGVLYQEMQQAYGTWEWSFKTTGSANKVNFISSDIASTVYEAIQFDAAGRIMIQSSEHANYYTATNYYTDDVWYEIRVTRKYDGQYTIYIKGGDFSEWTLVDLTGGNGTNPYTETTPTTNSYIALSLVAGDCIANFRFYQGVMTP